MINGADRSASAEVAMDKYKIKRRIFIFRRTQSVPLLI